MFFLQKIGLRKSLYGGFGIILMILVGIGLLSYLNFLKVSVNLGAVDSEMEALNTKIVKLSQDSKAMVHEAGEVQDFVEKRLVTDMKNRTVDLKILSKTVERIIRSFEDVLAILDKMSMDERIDEKTREILEDMLFDVDDIVDSAKKESLPAVRKIVKQLLHSVENAEAVGRRVNNIQNTATSLDAESVVMSQGSKRVRTVSRASKISADTIRGIILYSVVVSVLLAGFLAYFLVRSIVKGITLMVKGFKQSASEVALSSRKVSRSSQQLSQGATQQASSLEETSSSLDQLNAMTKQNAENTARANQLALDSKASADRGDEAMKEMQAAMKGIRESSSKIEKIIKTIEEIAFQTNLLALNAAVEAARAGEQGKGFAVVADEVRNLAQRSAVAAKETAQLIEESIQRSTQGEAIVNKAVEVLKEITDNSNHVASIVAEISVANKEQSEGIDQIANAVAQLDSVTQQNAATSQETAAAAQELSKQSNNLQDIINGLQQLVGGMRGVSFDSSVLETVEGHVLLESQAHPKRLSSF